jgi:O-antigen/teichoic acid export membrane protein
VSSRTGDGGPPGAPVRRVDDAGTMTESSEVTTTRSQRSASLRSAAFHGSLWSASYRWSARLVSFATFVVLSRLLEPAEFGVVAMASAVAGFLGILVDFGLPRFVVHAPRADDVLRSTVLWCSLALGSAIALVQVLAAPLVATWLREPSVEPVLRVMALGYPLSALYGVLSAFQKRELKFKLLAVRGMVAVVVSAAVAVGLAVAGYGVWALVGQVLCYAGVSLVVLWLADPWVPRLLWSRQVFMSAFRYGRAALGAAVMDSVTSYGDGLVVGRRLGPDQLGYYSIAFRLVQVVLDLLVSVVHTVAFPILARAQDDARLLAAAYRRSVTQGVLISAPAVALLAALMPELVDLVFGPKWAPVAGVGAVLAVSRVLLVPLWFDSALLYAIGRVRLEFALSGAGAVTLVLAVVVGSFWGLEGVAFGLVGRSLVMWPLRMVVSCRLVDRPVLPVAAATVRIWAAAAVSGGVAWVVAQQTASQIAAVVSGSLFGLVTFMAAAWLLARNDFVYLVGTVRHVRLRRARE